MESNATGKRYADELLDAESLDELAAICERIAEEPQEVRDDLELRRIWTFLPTWGPEPADPTDCVSWDEKRKLLIDHTIGPRYDVEDD